MSTIPSPAPDHAEEPWLLADGNRVLMTWQEKAEDGGGVVRFASLDVGAGAWSDPLTVVESPDLMVNWADFPTLVRMSDGTLAAHWLRRAGTRGHDYEIWMTLSHDDGASWSEPFKLHRDDVAGEHGFVSLVPEPAGGLTAVWLDGRETGREGGAMTLRSTTVAADGALGPEEVLDSRICDCCQTDATRVGGRVVAVYRDRSDDEIRDIYAVTHGSDGWGEPVRVATDDWQISGCPVNGPAIAAHDGRLAVTWFTLGGGGPRVRVAFSDDAAATFSAPIDLETGALEAATLGRADAVWLRDRLLVTWLTDVGGRAELRYAVMDAAGTVHERGKLGETSAARSSGFPRLASAGDRAWVAWRVPDGEAGLQIRELSLATDS